MTTFFADRTLQSYIVPPGVTSLLIAMTGGQGGGTQGGSAAGIQGTLAVTPGEVLRFFVGLRGTADGTNEAGYGALGGQSQGAYPGGEGGGSTVLFQGGLGRANQRAVAGGGGGQGGNATGTLGGGGNAGNGVGAAGTNGNTAPGGGPGSTTSATGGTATGSGSPFNGGPDAGGTGGFNNTGGSGGGGGAGYYGGAGGAASPSGTGGGGGGGSCYFGGLTAVTYLGAGFLGAGKLIITIPNQPPYAPPLLSPAEGTTIDRALPQTLKWQFADPIEGDSQSAYELRVAPVGTGSFTSTGKIVTTDQFRSYGAGTLALGTFEWQVRTWDSGDLVGPWSPSHTFTVADLPATPTLTGPASPITAPAQNASWSAVAHTSYQVRRSSDTAGTVVYYDSGEVVSGANAHALAFDTTSRIEHVQVRVKASSLWSAWADSTLSVEFTPPPPPTFVLTTDSFLARIKVKFANPAPAGGQPAVVSHEVYRRVGTSGDGIRIAKGIAPGAAYFDRTPASGVGYSYLGVSVAANGARSQSSWVSTSTEAPPSNGLGLFGLSPYGLSPFGGSA